VWTWENICHDLQLKKRQVSELILTLWIVSFKESSKTTNLPSQQGGEAAFVKPTESVIVA